MAQMGRPGLSAWQKDQVWQRWRKGESFSEISRAVGRAPGSIFGVLKLNGGITPVKRCRSRFALTLPEREEISRGIASRKSIRKIALTISRSPSTVSREIKRNGGLKRYRAVNADEQAWKEAKRPKLCKLILEPLLCKIVSEKLALEWSPEQISGWLKCKYPLDKSMHISHETIYRSLFIQSRKVLKKELMNHLRTNRRMRHSKQHRTKGKIRGGIPDGLSIRERPKAIESRKEPGHWEGDLIAGSGNTHIATLVERFSRYTILVKVDGKDSITVTEALGRHMSKIPSTFRKTLTWDRGMELVYHKQFTRVTNIPVYFCDPQSSWQRGSNENTNGLLRQYLPKKTDLSIHSQEDLNRIALRLNERPRKILGYSTPSDRFGRTVALTS
jgi:transposase, IS30 family